MKPKEKSPQTVYRIIERSTGRATGSYSRSCGDEYDFHSVEAARNANCHGVFANKVKFSIARYRVTYELIDEDCDPATDADRAKAKEDDEFITFLADRHSSKASFDHED